MTLPLFLRVMTLPLFPEPTKVKSTGWLVCPTCGLKRLTLCVGGNPSVRCDKCHTDMLPEVAK